MNKALARIISVFIIDKEKRREFRLKHDSTEKLRKRLCVLEADVNYMRKFICGNQISAVQAMESGFIDSYEEHLENLSKLKANLSKEAMQHLNKILEMSEKIDFSPVFMPQVIYNDEDLKSFASVVRMEREIKKVENYWQYKNYKLPIKCFEPSVFLHKQGLSQIKSFASIDKDDVIIDAGAHILDTALILREFFPNKIISFEPVKETYELGLKTIELNRLQNVVYENKGLGDYEGPVETYTQASSAGNTMVKMFKNSRHSVECCHNTTLDNYVKKHSLKVGLIKTDVEGFEQNLLRGAIETIKKQRPILLISIYHSYNDFYKIKPYIENLSLNYKFDFYKGADRHPNFDIMLICEPQ